MKKKILKILCLLLALFITTTNVYATSIAEAGDEVTQEGDYNSIRLVAGNKVTSKANIDGLSLIAGNEITVEGYNAYGLYAGNSITISANINKDLFVAGNKIVIEKNARLGRDVFIVGSNVTIMTNIPRDLRLGAETVNLSGITINGDAYIMADEIIMDQKTNIIGKLTYSEDTKVTGLDLAKIGEIEKTPHKEVVIQVNLYSSILEFIFSLCAGFIVMLVLFYLLPKTKDKLDKLPLTADNIFKRLGIGFLVLICVPIIFIIAVFTSILTPLSLILCCMYIIGIYLSSLLTSYVIGNVLTQKIFNKESKYLALLIGILVLKLIKLIPAIGPFIGFISLLFGLGLIYCYLKNRK